MACFIVSVDFAEFISIIFLFVCIWTLYLFIKLRFWWKICSSASWCVLKATVRRYEEMMETGSSFSVCPDGGAAGAAKGVGQMEKVHHNIPAALLLYE